MAREEQPSKAGGTPFPAVRQHAEQEALPSSQERTKVLKRGSAMGCRDITVRPGQLTPGFTAWIQVTSSKFPKSYEGFVTLRNSLAMRNH